MSRYSRPGERALGRRHCVQGGRSAELVLEGHHGAADVLVLAQACGSKDPDHLLIGPLVPGGQEGREVGAEDCRHPGGRVFWRGGDGVLEEARLVGGGRAGRRHLVLLQGLQPGKNLEILQMII